MYQASLYRWARTSLITGRLAFFWGTAAVAIPTIVRASANDALIGCEFTPYLPFVLLSALALGWWQASAVALASVAVFGTLFYGPTHEHVTSSCFVSGSALFLASSAMMIGVIELVRRTIDALQNRGARNGAVVFSLKDDQVWASWYDEGPPVRLGAEGNVSEMMRDFLAQVELGKRLTATK